MHEASINFGVHLRRWTVETARTHANGVHVGAVSAAGRQRVDYLANFDGVYVFRSA